MYLVWRAIKIPQLADLQVICVVAEGATPNRKFFKLHKMEQHMKSGITYFAPNVCRTPGNNVSFIADVPHFIKTISNEWHNLQHKRSGHLVVSSE